VFNASPNPEFSHSLIANSGGSGSWDSAIGTDGGNNIAADPLFVAPLAPGLNTGGDYRLQACSPAINAGSNAAVPMGVTTDLDGNGRFFNNGIVDMGAYEFQGEEIADNENPIAICPTTTPTVVLDGNGNGTLAENALASGNSTDNCNVTETSPMTGFTCADAPSATVVLTATDAAGNSSTANCTVNIVDNEAPVALCQNLTVQLDANGSISIIPQDVDNGSSDACGIQSLSLSRTDFGCADVGNNTVTLTATDANTNMGTCSATVNVTDNNTPTAVCDNQTVNLTGDGITTVAAAFFDGGSSAVCGGLDFSASMTAFDCDDVGEAYTVTLTVTSQSSGLSDQCTSTVTVEDPSSFCCAPPMAACDNITVQLDAGGNGSTTAGAVDNGSNDACGVASLSLSQTSFGCAEVGANTETLTVTDVNGNVSTCSTTVTVEDNVAPAALCQNVTVQLDANGSGSTTAGAVDNGSNDACGVASLSLSQTSFGCAEVGANTETLTVTDVNGNVSTCSTTVTVEDNVAPAALCQNVTVQLDANGNGSTTAVDVDNGSNDACGVASLSLSQTSFGCAEVGANTETLTVTDVNGNVSTCSTTVTVEDNVAPTALCQNVTVQLDANGNGSTTAGAVDNGSNDACGVASLSLSQTSFGCAEVGANTETLTVTDVNGNVSTCSTTVTVEDNVAPAALCQNVTVQLDANGSGSTTAGAVDNGSNDACGVASLSFSQTSFGCAEVGANTETLTVTDVNGNVSTCSTTVTVEDNVAPAALCQNVTVQLDANGSGSTTAVDVDNGSNDACGVASLSLSQTSFGCAEVGANTETLTVTDVNGNVSTCSTTVTVEDNVAPAALCQNVTVQLDANGSGSTTAGAVDNGSNDACGVASLSFSQTSFGCAEVGANTETLTVTDVNGNVSTCSTTVTVEDNVAPAALCQNVTVQLDANGSGSTTAVDVDNGSNDACGVASLSLSQTSFGCAEVGANTETLTVTDVNGNVSTCSTTVTVEDNVAPTALCQNLTVQLDANGNSSITPQDVDNGSSDACGIGGLSVSPGTFGCGNTGGNTVTLTVTDVNTNTASCTATVTVEDNIDPTAACLNTTVEIQPDGFYDLQQSDVYDATNSSDNCSIASVSFPATTFGCDDLDLTFPVMVTVTDPSGNTDDCTANVSVVAGTALPPEWSANDIGNQGSGSDYAYDPCAGNNPSNGDFTISTGGYNLIPQNSDNVAFSSVPLCGNGGIQARIKDVVGGYAGLMIRESSAPGAKMFAVYSNLTNLLRREIRTVENGQRSSNTFFASFPQWLRLVRQGNYIQAFYRNSNGGNWTLFHQAYLPMGNCVEMGLAVFTTDPSGDASAVFGKVNYLSQGGQSLSTPNTLSWEAETPEVQSASVLPNPVRGNFTLQFSKPLSTAGQATLLNEFGQRIAQQPLRAGERQVDWDAGALPAGLYFLEVATADGYREVLKVVRQ
jgi:regulation of enolase protein 1 (concanavalin A-like superfamily)